MTKVIGWSGICRLKKILVLNYFVVLLFEMVKVTRYYYLESECKTYTEDLFCKYVKEEDVSSSMTTSKKRARKARNGTDQKAPVVRR